MGFDPITLALARGYADSQRLGYAEPGAVLTFDGNFDCVTTSDNLLLLTSKEYDIYSITSVTIQTGTITTEIPRSSATVAEIDGAYGLVFSDIALVVVQPGKGTLVYATKAQYVTRVEFAETIHTIDEKYLPGVCLPVVELETVVVSGATFTDAENAALTAAKEAGVPFVLKCVAQLSDEQIAAVAIGQIAEGGGLTMLVATIATTVVILMYGDGAWYVADII